jgi:hypothetical protein
LSSSRSRDGEPEVREGGGDKTVKWVRLRRFCARQDVDELPRIECPVDLDFEVFEVNTIVTDNKGSPDRKSDTLSQNILFLSDLSDFEVFEVNTIVTDIKRSPNGIAAPCTTFSPFRPRPTPFFEVSPRAPSDPYQSGIPLSSMAW